MVLADAVKLGRLAGLVALRDALASEIEAGPPGERAISQTAPLARQLRDVLRDIEELEKAAPKGTIVDDLKSRRKARVASPAGVVPAERGGAK